MDFVGTAVAADAVADHSVWWMMIQKHEQNFTLMVMMVIYDYSDNDNNGGDDGDNDSALCIMILGVE